MNSCVVVCALNISDYAFSPLKEGASAFTLACNRAKQFPNCEKIVILTDKKHAEKTEEAFAQVGEKGSFSEGGMSVRVLDAPTLKGVFTALAEEASSFDVLIFTWADEPFIDIGLTKKLYEQHCEYKAEYSFADGFPEGLAPQILVGTLPGILAQTVLEASEEKDIARSFIFDTIKKEINSYDIETLIAPLDVRQLRVRFSADTKRNLALCNEFLDVTELNYASLLAERSNVLRAFPSYYGLELVDWYPLHSLYKPKNRSLESSDAEYMKKEEAFLCIQKISSFSDDAVISLSLFGEPSLHPDIGEIIEYILQYPKLSVLIETSGLGWHPAVIEKIAAIDEKAPKRENGLPAFYWIVCMDAVSPNMYGEIHHLSEEHAREKLAEAMSCVDTLRAYFPKDVWVQIIRMNENEKELEPFYRLWKEKLGQVIIQKYDHMCTILPDRRVADLAPLERNVCWHLKRDMSILSDGTVPLCKEDRSRTVVLGNAFSDDFSTIWANALNIYQQQIKKKYQGLCEHCDEYYTYNF